MRPAPTPALRVRARGLSSRAEPCAPAARQTRRAGAGNVRDSPAPRPSSVAGLPPHRPSGPGRPSPGLEEAWRSSAAPPTYPHSPRRGTADGKGKRGAVQAAVRRQPRLPGPSSRGSPRITRCQNLNRPGTAAPSEASSCTPLPPARPATREGVRPRPPRSVTGHSAAQPSCLGCTEARPPPRRHRAGASATPVRTGNGGRHHNRRRGWRALAPLPRRPSPTVRSPRGPAAAAPARSLRCLCGGAPRAAWRACRPDGGPFPLLPFPSLPPYLFQR